MPDGEVENRILPGLVSVTFRKLTPPQIVELVSLGRLVGVEWGGDVHVPHGDLARGEEVGRMTRDAGLAVAAYGSYFEVGESEAEGLSFASVLETALALGAPLIRVWAGRSGPAQTDATTRQRIIADSQRITRTSPRYGKRPWAWTTLRAWHPCARCCRRCATFTCFTWRRIILRIVVLWPRGRPDGGRSSTFSARPTGRITPCWNSLPTMTRRVSSATRKRCANCVHQPVRRGLEATSR
jgi:hypothetical protein